MKADSEINRVLRNDVNLITTTIHNEIIQSTRSSSYTREEDDKIDITLNTSTNKEYMDPRLDKLNSSSILQTYTKCFLEIPIVVVQNATKSAKTFCIYTISRL